MAEWGSLEKPAKGSSRLDREARRRSRSGSKSSALTFAKGRSRDAEKREADQAQSARVREVRRLVWLRSSQCECCGARHGRHEMNETHSRARTAGRTPELRFDTRWCVRMCATCHRLFHAEKLVVYFEDASGADGRMQWFDPECGFVGPVTQQCLVAAFTWTPLQVWAAVKQESEMTHE